jgi:hypothetical protein
MASNGQTAARALQLIVDDLWRDTSETVKR